MWNLEKIARNVLKLSEDRAFENVIKSKTIQSESEHLNRDIQLYREGVNVDGTKMRSVYARFGNVYSNRTIAYKREKNQPIDRVTLRDTGAMYRTIQAKAKNGKLFLDANTIKDGKDLRDQFGQFIGLTEESKIVLNEKAKPIVIAYIRGRIANA